MGCTSSKTEAGPPVPSQGFLKAQPQLPQGSHGSFAPTFKLFYTGRKKLQKTDFFAIVAETGSAQVPLHVVTFHMGNLDLKKQVTLYAGTARDTAPLATAGSDKMLAKYAFVSLPGEQPGGGNRTETLVWPKGFTSQSFTVRVGASGAPETFEWRGENMTVASGSSIKPWNLVRVDAGQELVATWTELPFRAVSGEMGTFQFHGSGATGELGSYWALMTVTSWLWLLEQRYVINRFMDQMGGAASQLAFFGLGVV